MTHTWHGFAIPRPVYKLFVLGLHAFVARLNEQLHPWLTSKPSLHHSLKSLLVGRWGEGIPLSKSTDFRLQKSLIGENEFCVQYNAWCFYHTQHVTKVLIIANKSIVSFFYAQHESTGTLHRYSESAGIPNNGAPVPKVVTAKAAWTDCINVISGLVLGAQGILYPREADFPEDWQTLQRSRSAGPSMLVRYWQCTS